MFIFQKKTIKDQTKNKILENFFAFLNEENKRQSNLVDSKLLKFLHYLLL